MHETSRLLIIYCVYRLLFFIVIVRIYCWVKCVLNIIFCNFYKYTCNTTITGELDMNIDIIKPRCIRASLETFHRLKVISVVTKKTQDQVLSLLLSEEMQRLNINL